MLNQQPAAADRPAGDQPERAARVLHVVESLDRGAVENWLLRMLRRSREIGRPCDWNFFTTLGEAGAMDEAAKALGATVVASREPLGNLPGFLAGLRAEIRSGAYDALHCHHDVMSGFYIGATAGLGVARKIVHVHNADENLPTPSRLKQALAREPLRITCLGLADRIVGISDHTLDTFLGGRPRSPRRDRVHYYGVDPTPFASPTGTSEVLRAEMGVAAGAKLMLFGGRIVPEKNPVFAVDVLAQLRRSVPDVIAVFCGSGSMEAAVLDRAGELGVEDGLRMLGWRNDIPSVMAACDLFILPRPEFPMEGFGLAVVEAQLAGLPLLLSRGIPDDPLLPTAAYRRLALSDGAATWAAAARDLLAAPRPDRAIAHAALANSPMDMDRALDDLLALYQ